MSNETVYGRSAICMICGKLQSECMGFHEDDAAIKQGIIRKETMSNEKTTPTQELKKRYYDETGTMSYTYVPQTTTTDINKYEINPHYIEWLEKLAASAPVLRDLVEKQGEYIKFLGDEIHRKASYLECHGMGCSTETIEQGIKLRSEIEQLKQKL